MKQKIEAKSTSELVEIIKNENDFNQNYIKEIKQELLNRSENELLNKLENENLVKKENEKKFLILEIERQNKSNENVRKVLRWPFGILLIFAIRPVMRYNFIGISPFEKLLSLLILGLILFIIYILIVNIFYPIKKR